MTPTHTDSPLRRSNMSTFKTPAQTPIINDDEEERRQARRDRTFLDESAASTGSTIEENQALKDCLKICSDNKLSKENAWSVSLIDTLSNLLDRHHKSLNNFKVAGSSLEASSRVYGLRVDSVHTDVLRMSSGLYRHKAAEKVNEIDNDNENDNGANSKNAKGTEGDGQKTHSKPKRKRRLISTITRNEDTINGHLDTHPRTDPIFAKLNSVIGSINSSNKLLQNILPTVSSELKLRMDFPFWDSSEKKEIKYEAYDKYNYNNEEMIVSKAFEDMKLTNCVLRPDQCGYIISDTPMDPDDDEEEMLERFNLVNNEHNDNASNAAMALAFDINAEVEPVPAENRTFVDVDIDHFDDLPHEDQIAISKCKGLRRAAVVIDDMRPIDSTSSNLEYSYRPLDKISQFWAGPSHWKFKKSRKTSFSMAQRLTQTVGTNETTKVRQQDQRARKARLQPKFVNFGYINDDMFQPISSNKLKLKKVNIQKKWDAKKLKLPTDLQIDEDCFDEYEYAPGIKYQEFENVTTTEIPIEPYNFNNPTDQEYCTNVPNNESDYREDSDDHHADDHDPPNHEPVESNNSNANAMDISTVYEGAPDKITKIVVPFAKRAKVVDMKQLKYCCMNLVKSEFKETEKENIPKPTRYPNEKYKPGVATFSSIYNKLPKVLTTNMVEALSPTVAFYSILHLANDNNLRLVQQDDLNDFQVRQIDKETPDEQID